MERFSAKPFIGNKTGPSNTVLTELTSALQGFSQQFFPEFTFPEI